MFSKWYAVNSDISSKIFLKFFGNFVLQFSHKSASERQGYVQNLFGHAAASAIGSGPSHFSQLHQK